MERDGVAGAVARLGGIPDPPPPTAHGHGVNFAFASSTGRFRFVASIAEDGAPEGPPVPPNGVMVELAANGGDAWEWFDLAGQDEVLGYDGIGIAPERRLGQATAADELALREKLKADPATYRRLNDLVIAQEMIRILDQVNYVAALLRVDVYGLVLDRGPDGIRDLVRSIPVLTSMRASASTGSATSNTRSNSTTAPTCTPSPQQPPTARCRRHRTTLGSRSTSS